MLASSGMQQIRAILSDDIEAPANVNMMQVSPGQTYDLGPQLKLSTYRSTDLGVAFLVEDQQELICHAGDLNDWVWEEEGAAYNEQMTADYRKQIGLLSDRLEQREATVIRLRYFHCLTQQRVAKVLDVSQVQVSRIEKKALAHLKELLS